LPVCSAVFGGSYRRSLWRHIRRPWFVMLRRNFFCPKRLYAFASAADAVPVELWVTRLRYP
jgi:hypothetical protein